MGAEPTPKDILGVPLEVGDTVATCGSGQLRAGFPGRSRLIVGNICSLSVKQGMSGHIEINTRGGRKIVRYCGEVAFISRNPRGP